MLRVQEEAMDRAATRSSRGRSRDGGRVCWSADGFAVLRGSGRRQGSNAWILTFQASDIDHQFLQCKIVLLERIIPILIEALV